MTITILTAMLQKTNAIQPQRTIATLIIGKKYDEII